MAKLNISAALVAALVPSLTVIAEGSGKLWDAARDSYLLALVDFPKPQDAVAAMRQVMTDSLKANAGSLKAYTSHLVWLSGDGKRTPEQIAGMSMQDATNARYPKAPKPGQEGFVEYAAKLDKAAKDKAEQKAREEAERATPRSQLLSQIASVLADCSEDELSLFAAELIDWKAALRDKTPSEEAEVEQEAETIAA